MSRMGVVRQASLRPAAVLMVVLATVLVASGAPAQAHLMNSGFGPFYDGAAHPLLSPEDLLAVAATALLAGQSGAGAARWLLATLPAAWLLAMTAAWALALPGMPAWIAAATTALTGGAVAAAVRLRPAAVLGLGAVIGAVHGLSNGAELGGSAGGLLASAGTACCIAVIVALLAGQVTVLRAHWARLAVRISGSWIAAIGLLMLGWLARA